MFVPDSMHRRYTPRRYPNLCRVRINNESLCPSLSLSLSPFHPHFTYTPVPIFFYFRRTYACTHVGTCSYSVSFLLGSGINGTGEEWTGREGVVCRNYRSIRGRKGGSGSRFERTYSWEEIEGGTEEIR